MKLIKLTEAISKALNEISDETVDRLIDARTDNYLDDIENPEMSTKLAKAQKLAIKRAERQGKKLGELKIADAFRAFAKEMGFKEVKSNQGLNFKRENSYLQLRELAKGLTVELYYGIQPGLNPKAKRVIESHVARRTAQEVPKEFKQEVVRLLGDKLKEAFTADDYIFNLKTVRQALDMQRDWLASQGIPEDGKANEVMFFVIEDGKIVDTKLVKREDVYTYQPQPNEYFLDMTRDSGFWDTDFQLSPVQLMVDRWNRK